MRRVKKACVSSSAIPSWWSTQPSRVTLMLKVKSPMLSFPLFEGIHGRHQRLGVSRRDLHPVSDIFDRAEARPFHARLVVHPAFRRQHLTAVLRDRFCHFCGSSEWAPCGAGTL